MFPEGIAELIKGPFVLMCVSFMTRLPGFSVFGLGDQCLCRDSDFSTIAAV